MKRITLLCIAISMSIYTNSMTDNIESCQETNTTDTEVQRVRIDFVSPNGFIRHLLLSFTPDNAATDGIDYGYDGRGIVNFPNDLNWLIEGERFIVQGVGAFDESKRYPFGLYLADAGDIEISLTALENFDTPINVYIYDKLLDTYTTINDSNYASNLDSGEYLNRFYIAFFNATLNDLDNEIENLNAHFSNASESIVIINPTLKTIKSVELYNILGQSIYALKEIPNTDYSEFKTKNISRGTYIIKLETETGTFTKKVLVE